MWRGMLLSKMHFIRNIWLFISVKFEREREGERLFTHWCNETSQVKIIIFIRMEGSLIPLDWTNERDYYFYCLFFKKNSSTFCIKFLNNVSHWYITKELNPYDRNSLILVKRRQKEDWGMTDEEVRTPIRKWGKSCRGLRPARVGPDYVFRKKEL